MKGRYGILVASALGLVLVMAGCSKGPNPGAQAPASGSVGAQGNGEGAQGNGQTSGQEAARPGGRRFATIPVQAAVIQVGPLVADNNTAGTIVPVTQSQVASQVAGVVSRVVHNAGDWVKAGEVVVQLDDSQLKLSVQSAQAALGNAKINLTIGQQTTTGSNPKLVNQLQSAQTALASAQKNYNSQKTLFDLGGIAASALDNAQSQLQQAQANVQDAQLALDQNNSAGTQTLAQMQLAVDQANAQLAMAQLNLQYASIPAPFAGQIAAVNVNPGVYVSQNTPVFLLVSGARQIDFSVPPIDAPNFPVGSTVRFTFNGKTYPVKIIQEPSAPINGVVPMVAAAPSGLAAGYGTVGTITYTETIATGALIPISALQTRANINFVDLVVNARASEQSVTILAQSGDTAVVTGLQGGEQVVLNAPPGLVAGSSVQAVVTQAASSGASGSSGAAATGGEAAQAGGQGTSRTGATGLAASTASAAPSASGTPGNSQHTQGGQ